MSRHFPQVWAGMPGKFDEVWAAMGVMVMCMYQLVRDKNGFMTWGSIAEHVLRCGQRRLDVKQWGRMMWSGVILQLRDQERKGRRQDSSPLPRLRISFLLCP